jgi:prepilin-type N-terminal cleavage/methylation domain-containing protein
MRIDRLLATARRGRAADSGMTMIEMVVTITILGIIAVPLFMSVSGALRFAPEASARSARASDRYFLADSFERDTTNASSVTLTKTDGSGDVDLADGTGKVEIGCGTVSDATVLTLNVVEATLNSASVADDYTTSAHAVTYKITISQLATAPALGTVKFQRTSNGATKDVTVGYCTWGDAKVVVLSSATKSGTQGLQHQSVDLSMKIAPQPSDSIEQVEYKGAFGKTIKSAPTS